MQAGPSQAVRLARGIFLLALAYAAAGWLGRLLSAPVDGVGAALIWPAAGIAVAALLFHGRRLWPGVPLGMLLLYALSLHGLLPGISEGAGLGLTAGGMLALALGATLQPLIAVALVRRRRADPLALRGWADIGWILLSAGPVATLLAALVAFPALVLAGGMGGGQAAGAGLSLLLGFGLDWWLGNTLGVVLMLPVAALFPTRPAGSLRWRGRRVARANLGSSLIALVGVLIAVFLSIGIGHVVTGQREDLFGLAADHAQVGLQRRMRAMSDILDTTTHALELGNGVDAVAAQKILDGLDAHALSRADAIGVIAPGKGGSLTTVAERRFGGAPGLAGRDLAAMPGIAAAAMEAAASGRATISTGFRLPGGASSAVAARGVRWHVLLQPIYSDHRSIATREDRLAALDGWSFLLLDAQRSFGLGRPAGTLTGQLQIVANRGAVPDEQVIGLDRPTGPQFSTDRSFTLFQRLWVLRLESTPTFEALTRSYEPQIALLAGIVLSILLSALVTVLYERERAVRAKVVERTRQLAIESRKLQTIIESASVGILFLNARSEVIFANNSAPRKFGRDGEALVGMSLGQLMPDLWREHALDAEALRHGRLKTGPIAVTTPLGAKRWLECRATSYTDEHDEEVSVLILTDVTEMHNGVLDLQAAERRWNLALDGSQIGVYELDLATNRLFASEAWLRLAGFGPEAEVDAQAEWLARVHPDDMPAIQAGDQECFAGRTDGVTVEYRFRLVDGRWRWMRSDAKVVARDADGRAQRLLGTMTDVTPLREALEQAEYREAEMRELIANTPVAMAVFDLRGKFEIVNDAFCAYTGFDRETLLDPGLDAAPVAAEVLADREALGRLMSGEILSHVERRSYVAPDGTERFGLLTTGILRDSRGGPPRFVGQIVDVTEQERLIRMRADFVATVSHELRTPLTSITGAVKLIMGTMASTLPERTGRLLAVASQNCDRLGRLVDDLLDMQRFSSGQMDLALSAQDVSPLVEQSLAEVRPVADRFRVSFAPIEGAEEALAVLDRFRFKQVMGHLLSNAAKFSDPETEVVTRVECDGGAVTISVTNTGPGIPADFGERVFEPFSQVAEVSTRSREGSGLGLSISKEIVERMDGQIGFRSTPGGTTTFWLRFPRARPDERDAA
ncbi:PAS domain S-box protein [Solirhodobacter olei]|uniref:PAS domain S-box protein n=1 Tax=Solirhodobacter olei TaxID=2493082 RepID=UPI000FDB4481|nr:PAS domain S-box protein [Solirhodobacter olei]